MIDLIIEILRGSKNSEQVKKCLVDGHDRRNQVQEQGLRESCCRNCDFTEKQATAILDMRLYKLIGLEIEALQADHAADDEEHRAIRRYPE